MSTEDKYTLHNVGAEQASETVNVRTVRLESLDYGLDSETFDDLGRKTNEFLKRIRSEAGRIVDDAHIAVKALKQETATELQRELDSLEKRATELEKARQTLEADLRELEERRKTLENESFKEARKDGFKQGFSAGQDEGYKQGEKKAHEELEARFSQCVENRVQEASDSILEPLHKLVHEMKGARQALLKNWEGNIMQIAAAIAYQTILQEPEIMKEAPLKLLQEALEMAMNCATLKIRMNPDDVNVLRDQIRVVLEDTGNLAKSEVIADPKITRGGCLVETNLGVVDERLESRLERIVAELSE